MELHSKLKQCFGRSRQLPLCYQVYFRKLEALLHVLLLILIVSSLSEFGKMHMAPNLTALCCACKTSLNWHDTYHYIVINWMVIQHATRKKREITMRWPANKSNHICQRT